MNGNIKIQKKRDELLEFSKLPRYSANNASGLILGLRPANERRRYKLIPSVIGWAQT